MISGIWLSQQTANTKDLFLNQISLINILLHGQKNRLKIFDLNMYK